MQLFYIKLYSSSKLYVSRIIHVSLFFVQLSFDSYVWQVPRKTIYIVRQPAKATQQAGSQLFSALHTHYIKQQPRTPTVLRGLPTSPRATRTLNNNISSSLGTWKKNFHKSAGSALRQHHWTQPTAQRVRT